MTNRPLTAYISSTVGEALVVSILGGGGGGGVVGGPLTILGGFSVELVTEGDTQLTLPTSGTVTALGNTTTGSGHTIVLAQGPSLTQAAVSLAADPQNPMDAATMQFVLSVASLAQATVAASASSAASSATLAENYSDSARGSADEAQASELVAVQYSNSALAASSAAALVAAGIVGASNGTIISGSILIPGFAPDTQIVDMVLDAQHRVVSATTSDDAYAISPVGLDQVATLRTIPDTYIGTAYVPGFGLVAELTVDAQGRTVGVTDSGGAEYRVGVAGLEKMATSSDLTERYQPPMLVPGIAEPVVSVESDALNRVTSATGQSGVTYKTGPRGMFPLTGARSPLDFDAVIYGSSLAGIMAAVRLTRRGWRVAVLEPTSHFGGMHAAGLSYVDQSIANSQCIGGDVNNTYFPAIIAVDGNPAHKFQFEPKTAEKAAIQLLSQNTELMLLNCRINGPQDVVVTQTPSGPQIVGIVTPIGLVTGSYFVGAAYTGDLLRYAGVPYTYGREASSEYGEPQAGYLPTAAAIYSNVGPIGYPVLPDPGETTSQADSLVQSYNFRLCCTRVAGNMLRFPKPDGYSQSIVRQTLQIYAQQGIVTLLQPSYASTNLGFQGGLANQKVNSNGFDFLNGVQGYVNGLWSTRDDVEENHYLYQASVLWAIQNESDLMSELGLSALYADAQTVGLCADEFANSKFAPGWSHSVYPRETLRGEMAQIMTYFDVVSPGNTKSNSIAKWGYPLDCHPVQAYTPSGTTNTVAYEGFLFGATPPVVYQIPMGVVIPPSGSVTNFTEAVCVGASHVAWAPTRLEVCFGLMGEACGEIGDIFLSQNSAVPVQNTQYSQLASRLTQYGSLL